MARSCNLVRGVDLPDDTAAVFAIDPGDGIPEDAVGWTHREVSAREGAGRIVRNVATDQWQGLFRTCLTAEGFL